MRISNGRRVEVTADNYGVPLNSRGTVVGMDNGDTDFDTYEIRFDNGFVAHEVRHYHLIVVGDGLLWADQR